MSLTSFDFVPSLIALGLGIVVAAGLRGAVVYAQHRTRRRTREIIEGGTPQANRQDGTNRDEHRRES